MGAGVQDPVDEPCGGGPAGGLQKTAASLEQKLPLATVWTSHAVTAAAPTPWKRSRRPGPFAGDVATVGNRLALAPYRVMEPQPFSSSHSVKHSSMIGIIGVVGAMAVGAVGYQLGSMRDDQAQRPALRFDPSDQQGPAAERYVAPMPAPQEQQSPSAATSREGASGVRLGATGAQRADEAAFEQVSNAPAGGALDKFQQRRFDPDDIAAIIRNGAAYMTNGSVGAARMMLHPAADAGDAAACFALAETYDPLVLRQLNARGGIAADVELAQGWYRKAKELGSSLAQERLERLARLAD